VAISGHHVRDHGTDLYPSCLAHPFVRSSPTANTGGGIGRGQAIRQPTIEAIGIVSLANDAGESATLSLPIDLRSPVAAPDTDLSAPAAANDQERQQSSH
jgi:hypothetical protein